MQNHYTTYSSKNFPYRPPPPSTCTRHNGHKYYWLTQEDVIRFLLNSLGAFSPIPTFTIDSLNITDPDIMTITYNEPASSALPYFRCSLTEQTSITVVDEQNQLICEISPFALSCSYDLHRMCSPACPVDENEVTGEKTRLRERNLVGTVEMIDGFLHAPAFPSSSSCSSNDESKTSGLRGGSGLKYFARRAVVIVGGPQSSLIADMIQAFAQRVSCVWGVDEGYSVVGGGYVCGDSDSIAGRRHNK